MAGHDLNETFRITALFGEHRDEITAIRDNQPIRPDSIVFREGRLIDPTRAAVRLNYYEQAASIRLLQGDYSGVGQAAVDAILSDTLTGTDLYEEYSHTELKLLYGKGCVVYLADYANTRDDDLTAYAPYLDAKTKRNALEQMSRATTKQEQKVATEALWGWFTARRAFNRIRETAAAEQVVTRLDSLKSNPNLHSFAQTEDGRIETFIVFGLAHHISVTRKLQKAGLDVTRTPLADPDNLHPLDDAWLSEMITYELFRELVMSPSPE